MLKRLFHGSKDAIEKPIFGYGKRYNDYGMGFYCTEEKDMAKEWAVEKDRNGYVNAYEIELDGLRILDLREYSTLHWLAILLKNREFQALSPLAQEAKEYLLQHFLVDYENYDAIIGYRADDSYFSFAQDFIGGAISYRQLSNALRLGKLGEQFALKSEKAFERIRFLKSEVVDSEEWYMKKTERDQKARREYFDVERNRRMRDDLYITEILNEEMKEYDSRLR